MAGELKKRGENQYKSDDEDRKRVVPPKVRTFLDWDAEITDYVTGMIQSKLPADVTKSETKFMEISGSGFVWLPLCVVMYIFHPLVPKQLSVNLIFAFLLDVVIVGLLKAFARRRRPPTKKEDYFKSIGPDQYSFPSGHASRCILIAIIFTQINPIFDESFLQLVTSAIIWTWSISVCISRLINGRHYVFDIAAGIAVGFLESFIVSRIWMSPERAENILNFFSEEVPEI